MTEGLDPVVFVRQALAVLPSNPEVVTSAQLGRLHSIGAGLLVHVDAVSADSDGLLLRVLNGEASAEIEGDVRWQIALRVRCEQAQAELSSYARAAVRAHGINPDRLRRH